MQGRLADGETGFLLTSMSRPSIVCLDIMLRGADGFDILGKIKQKIPETIVLMVSGKCDSGTVEKAIQESASAFIIKPFIPESVSRSIERATLQLKD